LFDAETLSNSNRKKLEDGQGEVGPNNQQRWYSFSRSCLPQRRHCRGAACSFMWLLRLLWERKPRRQTGQ
jgi:hypothetical protein